LECVDLTGRTVHKTIVINAVGLTPSLIGEHTPVISSLARSFGHRPITSILPAVTCSVQATYLTGKLPREHGIVGNGWYFRDECEVKFWRQSNKLVTAPKIWDMARQIDPKFTCVNLFWWYNMYSSADYTVTPRPMYPADGRKLPDIYTQPPTLRAELNNELGQFPLFKFWGPATSIESTRWISEAAIEVDRKINPTLTLVYLPHLDYCLQRNPASASKDLRELDACVQLLLDHFQSQNARVILLSEYGITPVSRPVHLNRVLREMGLLQVRTELGRELLDAGASDAFAVADHQLAHVYVRDPFRIPAVREILSQIDGVDEVLDDKGKKRIGLDHRRSGELVVLAKPDSWFTYYYWLDNRKSPDFARTVDIHRKPGYDPAELFIDPKLKFPKLKIAWTLAKKKLGFRTLLDVIPLDASLVKGSHGRLASSEADGPILISNRPDLLGDRSLEATDICDVMLKHLTMP
jgi:predicted AlkP superfamily pyrophosphatase or phosphodiesterase